MARWTVTAGIIVSAENEDLAQEIAGSVLSEARKKGIIFEYGVDHVDFLEGDDE